MENIKFTPVHISKISIGDTIEHNGKLQTISGTNIKKDNFIGTTLFGDSYNLGTKLVKKVLSWN